MKLLSALCLATALTFAGCKALPVKTSETADVSPTQMAITPVPKAGMVAAANPLATQAGVDILRAGGSAVDAAVAVQAMLGLVEPQSSGLGGGAFMVVYDSQTGDVWAYDGRETAPSDIGPDLFLGEDGKPIRYFDGIASGKSTGAPGAMAMLGMAHEDYGKLPWGPHFDAALKTAEEGFVISPRMAGILARMGRFYLKADPQARAYFFEEGTDQTLPAGHRLKNPDYAEVLRALANTPRAMLEGPVAEKIVEVVRQEPRAGTLSLADMAAYAPLKKAGLCAPYRTYKICGARPPASGPVAVMSILGVLENFDMAAMGPSADGWHHFAEASFLGYADRSQYVGDEDFVNVPVKAMLDRDYLAARAQLIKSDMAMENVTAGDLGPAGQDATPDNPGTSHFTVVDKNGLVVSMTTTVEAPFGNQRMSQGFMLNNQLTDFSFVSVDADGKPVANRPQPGKRPRSSMAPVIVFDADGTFLFTTGSPGGNSIIAYTAKTIVGILDWGLSPQAAIELPNVIARQGSLKVEAKGIRDEETDEIDRGSPAESFGLSPGIVAGLEARGHKVVRSKGEFSGLHIIYRNPDGTLTGAADPRREGTAVSE